MRYQTRSACGDRLGLEISNRWKCQAHSTANVPASPTRGSQSSKRIFDRANNIIARSNARPKTGVGLTIASREVAIMSSKNGSTVELAVNTAARVSGALSPSVNFRPVLNEAGVNFRNNHILTATKKTANAPSRKIETGRPVRSAGILKISAPVAASVSNNTQSTGSSVVVTTA